MAELWRNSHSHIRQTGIHLNLGQTYLFKKAHAVREYVQVEGEFPPGRNEKCVAINERTNRTEPNCWTAWHQVSFCSICFGWENRHAHVNLTEWLLNFWWVGYFVSQMLFSRCCSSSAVAIMSLISSVVVSQCATDCSALNMTNDVVEVRRQHISPCSLIYQDHNHAAIKRSSGHTGNGFSWRAADQSVPEPERDAHK